MDGYYKFHRTDNNLGCERSCAMLNTTKAVTTMRKNSGVNFTTDSALAFFTKQNDFGELQSLRNLKERNFICMGNKTNADDTQYFRMILGGGTNYIDPIWQFCNITSIPPSAVVDFKIRDFTECSAEIIDQPQCPGESSLPDAIHGMYMLLYDDKGQGWSEAKYSIEFVPVSIDNFLASIISIFLPSPAPQSQSQGQGQGQSKGRSLGQGEGRSQGWGLGLGQRWGQSGGRKESSEIRMKSDDTTSGDDNTQGSDSNSDSTGGDKSSIIIATGALEVGKQTGYASLCLMDGCYYTAVSVGLRPDLIAWILCGQIGGAGMDAVFEVNKIIIIVFRYRNF